MKLEQLAATKKLGLKYLVAYDRDFLVLEEYKTPKQFVLEMGEEEGETEY